MSRRFRFAIRDIIMILIFGFIVTLVILNRSAFTTCSKPLDIWIIIDCCSIFIFRIFQYAFEWLISEPDPTRRNVKVPKLLASIHLWVLYPFLIGWTALGTVWFVQSFGCLSDSTRTVAGRTPFLCFLIFSYLHIIMFGLLIWTSARRINYVVRDQQRSTTWRLDRMQTLLLHMQQNPNYGLGNDNRGLTELEIDAIPTRTFQAGEPPQTCSICVTDMAAGDMMPRLPCQHAFHTTCLRPWALQNRACPNCRQEIVSSPVASV